MNDKKLSKEEVKHIADLARLHLSEAEVTKFQTQLSDILTYIDMLNEVDTTAVPPTAQTTGLINKLRPDEPEPSLDQQNAITQAGQTKNGYFKVKAVL
jgi:aspartyl-tRNA(Asn)/glutamyl-tRNA(Gln) amidotransferase subunit C